MKPVFILSLNDKNAALEQVGGKGASLARLANAGIPVPDGFHVTTAAYQQFVATNHLQPLIAVELAQADPARPASLEKASAAIRQYFLDAEIPGEIATEIVTAYGVLHGNQPPVAVRSSATAEDLPDASFAGQQETYLNIQGSARVLEAVRQCWASLWTARAIGYRMRQRISPESVALAVVVQLLFQAEAAGILFTANPVNGRRNETVVSAAWGLGEAVVGGLVTPDTLTIDRNTHQVINRQIAEKQVMTVCFADGTHEVSVPENLRGVAVLSDAAAVELTRLAEKIEPLYGVPLDIEWAWADGQFTIVQARPITTLPAEEPAEPVTWTLPNPKAFYARGSLAEHLPNPLTPLFGSLGIRLANQATYELGIEFLGAEAARDYQYRVMNGYTYLGIVMGLKETWGFTKTAFSQLGNMLGKGTERWREAREQLIEVVRKWEAKPVDGLSPSELLAGVNEMILQAVKFYTVIQAGTLPTASSSEIIFTRVYKLVKRKSDPEPTAFLFGFDTLPILSEKSLYDLAMFACDHAELGHCIRTQPSAVLAEALLTRKPPVGVVAEVWSAWLACVDEHLKNYGHTVYQFDFAEPTPAETPELLLDAVRMYLEGKGTNPYERQEQAAQKREAATQAVAARLIWPFKGWFKKSLKWAQDTVPVREDSLTDLGMAHPQVRRMLAELGRRFAAQGAIHKAEQIYWLEETEVNELVRAMEHGEPLPDLSSRIPERMATYHRQMRLNAPALMPETSIYARMIPWSKNLREGQKTISGQGTSPGKVTATARVLFGPEDFGQMRPGDVLVAVTTTPAWTPLFTMASAVVTDIGGPLSHSSIVAREFGIPAVMATGVATRLIQSGQVVTVDGAAGTVTLNGNHT